eukprot:scaffold229477_cov26-Tisochrysis_lutea.AAC.1
MHAAPHWLGRLDGRSGAGLRRIGARARKSRSTEEENGNHAAHVPWELWRSFTIVALPSYAPAPPLAEKSLLFMRRNPWASQKTMRGLVTTRGGIGRSLTSDRKKI